MEKYLLCYNLIAKKEKNVNMKYKEIDIRNSDELTFGQYIKLKTIISQEDKEIEIIEKIILCLYNKKPTREDYKDISFINYINKIVDDMVYWVKQENKALSYTPSIEEREAGIEELGESVGSFSIVKFLAKEYSKDPDDILNWSWKKVFYILLTDKKEFDYKEKFNKILERKYKVK